MSLSMLRSTALGQRALRAERRSSGTGPTSTFTIACCRACAPDSSA